MHPVIATFGTLSQKATFWIFEPLNRCASQNRVNYRIIARLLALMCFCLLAAPNAQAANEPKPGASSPAKKVLQKSRMHESLSRDERKQIIQNLKQRNPHFAKRGRKASNFKIEEPVLLLLEKRPHDKKSASYLRLADAYYYDYKTDETIHCIVDAKTGVIHQQRRVANLQLPLIEEEVQRAFEIYMQSPHRDDLADAYRDATGQALIDIGKLHFKAYVFHASTNPERMNKAAKRCGKSRCAQLLIYTHENIALNITPIIDLSKAKVLQGNTERTITQSLPGDETQPGHHHAQPHTIIERSEHDELPH